MPTAHRTYRTGPRSEPDILFSKTRRRPRLVSNIAYRKLPLFLDSAASIASAKRYLSTGYRIARAYAALYLSTGHCVARANAGKEG
eukprot:873870-Rhodomonas_salina.1